MGCCCSKSAIQVADAGAIEVLHETYTIQFMPQRPVVKRKKEKILNPREMIQFPKVRVTVQEQLSSGEIQTRTLTDADLKILSQSSIYHDIEFFIWNKENELHSESEEMFKDDYILRLSKGQQKNQAVWIRLKDAFYRESQIQIMTRASWQTVHQRRVRNCEISSALVLLSRAQELSHSDLLHRLILNHQIISGPEVNGNIINPKALYSKEGKYQIKLYFNGCWRVITIDDYLPSLPGGFTNISQEKECNTPLEQIELEEFRENKHESNKDEPIHKHEPFLKIPCPPESLLYPNQIRPLLCAFNWNDRQKILAEEIAIQAGKQSKFVQTKQKYMVDEEVQTISDNDIISLLGKDSSVSSQKLAKIQQQMILEAQMQLEKKLKETESQINEDEEWEEETEDEQNQTQNKKFDMNIALENIDTELDREIRFINIIFSNNLIQQSTNINNMINQLIFLLYFLNRMQHIREKEESEFWSIGGSIGSLEIDALLQREQYINSQQNEDKIGKNLLINNLFINSNMINIPSLRFQQSNEKFNGFRSCEAGEIETWASLLEKAVVKTLSGGFNNPCMNVEDIVYILSGWVPNYFNFQMPKDAYEIVINSQNEDTKQEKVEEQSKDINSLQWDFGDLISPAEYMTSLIIASNPQNLNQTTQSQNISQSHSLSFIPQYYSSTSEQILQSSPQKYSLLNICQYLKQLLLLQQYGYNMMCLLSRSDGTAEQLGIEANTIYSIIGSGTQYISLQDCEYTDNNGQQDNDQNEIVNQKQNSNNKLVPVEVIYLTCPFGIKPLNIKIDKQLVIQREQNKRKQWELQLEQQMRYWKKESQIQFKQQDIGEIEPRVNSHDSVYSDQQQKTSKISIYQQDKIQNISKQQTIEVQDSELLFWRRKKEDYWNQSYNNELPLGDLIIQLNKRLIMHQKFIQNQKQSKQQDEEQLSEYSTLNKREYKSIYIQTDLYQSKETQTDNNQKDSNYQSDYVNSRKVQSSLQSSLNYNQNNNQLQQIQTLSSLSSSDDKSQMIQLQQNKINIENVSKRIPITNILTLPMSSIPRLFSRLSFSMNPNPQLYQSQQVNNNQSQQDKIGFHSNGSIHFEFNHHNMHQNPLLQGLFNPQILITVIRDDNNDKSTNDVEIQKNGIWILLHRHYQGQEPETFENMQLEAEQQLKIDSLRRKEKIQLALRIRKRKLKQKAMKKYIKQKENNILNEQKQQQIVDQDDEQDISWDYSDDEEAFNGATKEEIQQIQKEEEQRELLSSNLSLNNNKDDDFADCILAEQEERLRIFYANKIRDQDAFHYWIRIFKKSSKFVDNNQQYFASKIQNVKQNEECKGSVRKYVRNRRVIFANNPIQEQDQLLNDKLKIQTVNKQSKSNGHFLMYKTEEGIENTPTLKNFVWILPKKQKNKERQMKIDNQLKTENNEQQMSIDIRYCEDMSEEQDNDNKDYVMKIDNDDEDFLDRYKLLGSFEKDEQLQHIDIYRIVIYANGKPPEKILRFSLNAYIGLNIHNYELGQQGLFYTNQNQSEQQLEEQKKQENNRSKQNNVQNTPKMSIRYLPPLKNIAKEVVGGWWRWPQDNLSQTSLFYTYLDTRTIVGNTNLNNQSSPKVNIDLVQRTSNKIIQPQQFINSNNSLYSVQYAGQIDPELQCFLYAAQTLFAPQYFIEISPKKTANKKDNSKLSQQRFKDKQNEEQSDTEYDELIQDKPILPLDKIMLWSMCQNRIKMFMDIQLLTSPPPSNTTIPVQNIENYQLEKIDDQLQIEKQTKLPYAYGQRTQLLSKDRNNLQLFTIENAVQIPDDYLSISLLNYIKGLSDKSLQEIIMQQTLQKQLYLRVSIPVALDNYGLHIPISQNPSSLNSEKDSTFQQSSFILGCMAPQGAKISRIEKLRAPWEEFQYEISFRGTIKPSLFQLAQISNQAIPISSASKQSEKSQEIIQSSLQIQLSSNHPSKVGVAPWLRRYYILDTIQSTEIFFQTIMITSQTPQSYYPLFKLHKFDQEYLYPQGIPTLHTSLTAIPKEQQTNSSTNEISIPKIDPILPHLLHILISRELPLPHKTTLIEVNKESRTTHPISINSEGIQFENADKNISNTKNQNKNLKDEKSKIQIQDFETERKWFTKDHRLAYPYFYGVLPSGKSILEMCVWGAAEMKFLAYVWTNQPVSLYSLSSDDM